MLESDWKRISKMLPFLRERYLVDQNARLVRMLTEQGKTDTDRFWDTFKEMKQQSKILVQCLSDYSRSNMEEHMIQMLHVGMLKQEDLPAFSEELQKSLARWLR
jgi:hypothetical protein